MADVVDGDDAATIAALRKEIEDWRGRLATQCGQTLAALHVNDKLSEATQRVIRAARFAWCSATAQDQLHAALRDYDACVAQLVEASDLKSDQVVVRVHPQAPPTSDTTA